MPLRLCQHVLARRPLSTVSEALRRSQSFSRYSEIKSSSSLSAAADQIVSTDSPLIVVGARNNVLGVVTEREILRGVKSGKSTVGDVAVSTRPCTPATTVAQALEAMQLSEFLPVIDPTSSVALGLLRKLDLLDLEKRFLEEKLDSMVEMHIHDG